MKLPTKLISSVAQQVGYRRREFKLVVCESVTLQDLNWSGGTRSEYHAVELETDKVLSAPSINRPHPMDNENEGARGAVFRRSARYAGTVQQQEKLAMAPTFVLEKYAHLGDEEKFRAAVAVHQSLTLTPLTRSEILEILDEVKKKVEEMPILEEMLILTE